MPLTSRDVAQRAGVSQSTVSRVLTGDSRVRSETRQRVQKALDELNYMPNVAARTMKTGRTGAVGVVISRLTNPFYPELLDAVGQALVEAKLHMVVWNAETGGEEEAARSLRERSVDGLILATATEESAWLWGGFAASAPIVLINRTVRSLPFDQVAGDQTSGAAAVARFFIDHGRDPIAVITAPSIPSTTVEREGGFLSALSEAGGIVPHDLVRTPAISHEEGRQAMAGLLRQAEQPKAVFCVSDLLAVGAMDALREFNVQAPEDVWVVGFDDIALASWGSYRLTTVRQPVKEMARLGLQALQRRLDEPDVPPEILRLPTRLIVRDSTRL